VTCFSMQPYVHPPPPLAGAKRKASLLQATAVGDASSAAAQEHHATPEKLPRTVTPILLAVLALIISDGIALGSLPLHLQSMGATPAVVGLATSAFSVAQMVRHATRHAHAYITRLRQTRLSHPLGNLRFASLPSPLVGP
jgi:hypothetical protein